MCVAVPARIVSISEGVAHATVAEAQVAARLDLLDEPVAEGDYILVHAGFALHRLPTEEAEETIALMREVGRL